MQNSHHVKAPEASVDLAYTSLSLSQRPADGKPGSSATARRLEAEASSAAICRSGQIVLGDLAADLAGMEAGVDHRPAGDRCSLASDGV